MKRKRLSKQERQRVYEKYGGRCAYCGQPITYNEMQVEHMEPLALGGPDSPENRVPSCRICNHYKHTLTVEGFRQQLDRITVRLQAREYTYKLALRHRRITENETPVKFYFEKIKESATTEEPLDSHSETEIVKGCIAMMQELTGQFETYLEFMGINPDTEEERFSAEYSYFHIVQRLLLWTTYHSGGTSTMEKCRELGFDSGDTVIFEDERYKEDDGV